MARVFDGTADYLSKDNVNIFDDSGFSSTSYSFSFSCWIRPDGRHVGGVFEQYAPDTPSGNGRLGIWLLNSGRIRVRYHNSYITTNTYHISTSTTTWYHLVGFWEYGERGLYVNGSASDWTNTRNTDDRSSDHSHSGVDFNIGRAYQSAPGTAKFFNGAIADCAAWKVKLSASDVSSLYSGFSPQLIRPDALLGHWPLGGAYSTDDADIDLVGGNHLTDNSMSSTDVEPNRFTIYPSLPFSFGVAAEEEEEEEEVATVKGFIFESMQMSLTQAGRRRFSIPDSPTASTNKGWSMESLQADITQAGTRRYSVSDSPTASTNKGWSFESLQAMITQGGARRK